MIVSLKHLKLVGS